MGCPGSGEEGLWACPKLSLAAGPTGKSSASDEGSARASGYSSGLPASHRPSGALSGALRGTVIDGRWYRDAREATEASIVGKVRNLVAALMC